MDNEPARSIGGTTMKKIIITKETTMEGARTGNKVLMVGKILNQREFERQQATSGKRLAMVGRIPNKREMQSFTKAAVNHSSAIEIEDRVEIPSFLLKAQEERRIEKIMQQEFSRNEKKAPSIKPSLKNIVKYLRSL